MKRSNLAFVIAGLLSLASFVHAQDAPSAKLASPPTSVPGNWTLYYDWGCTGSYGTLPMALSSAGTWSGGGLSGTWAVVGGTANASSSAAGTLTFNFNTAKTVYSGLLASKSVTGTQATFNGSSGCFTMLQSGFPSSLSEQSPSDKIENAAGER